MPARRSLGQMAYGLIALTGLLLASLTGCSAAPQPAWNAPETAAEHVIEVNEKGDSVIPGKWPHSMSPEHFDAQLKDISKAMERWHDQYVIDHPGAPRKLLLFVHGGVTSPESSYTRAMQQTCTIEKEGYYPIFIIWNPALWSTYEEHLRHMRRGQYENGSEWLWPFYLFADIGRAIARFPIVWTFQAGNDLSQAQASISGAVKKDANKRWLDNPQFQTPIVVTDALVQRYTSGAPNAMPISLGDVNGNPIDSLGHVAFALASVPTKYLLSPLLDGGGSAAWDDMYRRADVLFDGFTSNDLHKPTTDPEPFINPGPGAMVRLIGMLRQHAPARRVEDPLAEPMAADATDPPADLRGKAADPSGQNDWEVTLVGHSMGAIVLDEFIRRSPHVQYKNIVYMAAACSVRDFQRTVINYMQRHPAATFYNLCLHPVNELRESEGYGAAPHGSLLVWIDDMFSNPYTSLDRTLGRWDNVVEASFVVPPKLRSRVNLKGFSVWLDAQNNPPDNPQEHGDFSSMPYWKTSFWTPESPARAAEQAAPIHEKAQMLMHRSADAPN